MRQHVAKLMPVLLAGGCSVLYNPDRIDRPPADAKVFEDAPDSMIDANPADLMLTGVESPVLVEGQGDEGGRPAVLVVRGTNIVNGATITVAAATGTALVEVVDTPIVSAQNDLIAVKVIARVDTALAAGTTTDLVVTVSQPSPLGGTVDKTTTWQLKGLDELEGATGTVDTAMAREYSHVDVDTLTYSGTGKVIVRATAGIDIANAIDVSATADSATPGPGGGAGGTGSNGGGTISDGTGPGRGRKGVAGSSGGGGAGFVIAGEDGGGNAGSGGVQTGDVLITSYSANTGSGGGGATYFGGGGGGTLELTAGGNLTVGGTILAKGSAGGGGGLAATSGGGGGAGGCVVLRSGGAATVSGFDLRGGAAGAGPALGGKDGGAGRTGRSRVDAVTITGDVGPAHRGLMFDGATPVIVRASAPMFHLLGSMGDSFDLQRVNTSFAPLGDKLSVAFGGADNIDAAVPELAPGFNRVCAVPKDSGLANAESRNCVDLVYLP